MNCRLATMSAMIGLLCFGREGEAANVYRVQVVESLNMQDVDRVVSDLQARGISPVVRVNRPPSYSAAVGSCASGAEAECLLRRLSKLGYAKPLILLDDGSLPTADRPAYILSAAGSETQVFKFPADAGSRRVGRKQLESEEQAFQSASKSAFPALSQIVALSTTTAGAKRALDLVESQYETMPNEAKAMARCEMGRLRSRVGAAQSLVIDAYMPVADGTMPAPLRTKEKAAVAVAHALRYGLTSERTSANSPVEAYEAFREIARCASDDAIRSQASVECVALSLEAVKHRHVGSWEDVAAEAVRARSLLPVWSKRSLATIDLMELESHYYADEPDTTVELAERFMINHRDERREMDMARITAALAYRKLADKVRATELLVAVADQPKAQKAESFADLVTGVPMEARSMALQWLVIFAHQDGDLEAFSKYSDRFKAEFPDLAAKLDLGAIAPAKK